MSTFYIGYCKASLPDREVVSIGSVENSCRKIMCSDHPQIPGQSINLGIIPIEADDEAAAISTFEGKTEAELQAEDLTAGQIAVADSLDPILGKHTEEVYSSNGKLSKKTWYVNQAADGSLNTKAKEETYNYSGNKLISANIYSFKADGSIDTTVVRTYSTEDTASQKIIRVKEGG